MLLTCLLSLSLAQAPSSNDLLKEATAAWAKKDPARAIELATKAIVADPKNTRAYTVRAAMYEAQGAYANGVRDLSKVIELDPKDAGAYHERGSLNFKANRPAESLADFDVYLKMRPDRRPSHWQRGITCYYAGKFDEGRKQFEVYQDFDNADVENAVWRFMCMVRTVGLEKARTEMLKIGNDRRIPMRDIYELYLGKKTPDDVLASAIKGDLDPELKNRQLFYAHLYLGIWFDLIGERAKALDHLNKAADDHRIGHYMWDVARVHRDVLAAANGKK